MRTTSMPLSPTVRLQGRCHSPIVLSVAQLGSLIVAPRFPPQSFTLLMILYRVGHLPRVEWLKNYTTSRSKDMGWYTDRRYSGRSQTVTIPEGLTDKLRRVIIQPTQATKDMEITPFDVGVPRVFRVWIICGDCSSMYFSMVNIIIKLRTILIKLR